MSLEEYSQYGETLLHEQSGFAYSTYLYTIPQDFARLDLHWHDQMEIIYTKKGCSTVVVSSCEYPVMTSSIMPTLPDEPHAIDGDPNTRMEYENIIFPLSLLDNQVENGWARHNILILLQVGTLHFPRPTYADTAMHAEISAILGVADDACSERPDGYSLLACSSLFRFTFAFYTHRIREESLPPSPREDAIKRVLFYVQNHFPEPITASDATSLIDYNGAYFMRAFCYEMGFTFSEYLSDHRLRYASCLLRERPDSVGVAASLRGLDNLSYFIRCFRRKYGMSLREYRSHGRQNTKSL